MKYTRRTNLYKDNRHFNIDSILSDNPRKCH